MTTNDKDVFEEIRAMKKALSEKIQKEGQSGLKKVFKDFFERFPEVSSIAWAQYTPYFNDGDACTFRVRDFELRLKERRAEYAEDESYYGYGENCDLTALSESGVARDKEIVDAFCALSDKCHEVDDVLETCFGDHVKIVATEKGFDVDDYRHD